MNVNYDGIVTGPSTSEPASDPAVPTEFLSKQQPTQQKLIAAVSEGCFDQVYTILSECGSSMNDLVNLCDEENFIKTLLHVAAGNGNKGMVSLLLEKGADIDAKDEFRFTPLHDAARRDGHVEVVSLLLERGADIEAMDKYGRTALDFARTAVVQEKQNIFRYISALREQIATTAIATAATTGSTIATAATAATGDSEPMQQNSDEDALIEALQRKDELLPRLAAVVVMLEEAQDRLDKARSLMRNPMSCGDSGDDDREASKKKQRQA